MTLITDSDMSAGTFIIKKIFDLWKYCIYLIILAIKMIKKKNFKIVYYVDFTWWSNK